MKLSKEAILFLEKIFDKMMVDFKKEVKDFKTKKVDINSPDDVAERFKDVYYNKGVEDTIHNMAKHLGASIIQQRKLEEFDDSTPPS